MIAVSSFLNYAALQCEFGKAGLLRFDQTIEDVAEQRMKGLIGVLSQPSYHPARNVALRLNTEMTAAIYPADFDMFFPLGVSSLQKNAWVGTILDRCAEFVVVPFENWMCHQVIFDAVNDALSVNKRVSVLTDGALS
ncbi:hypothetical protein UM399_11975 [Sulfitobacter pontiacus]|uniref:hypothetical protein n=1 Tax=Sulfitobacter pontiacus TaxID=60137 RepID=UPI002AC9A06E|nr:hypothetical protein [Sulfitobacter pontiacus]WPZ24880.1 hypothetical protein UM399_11975 [Sulfitobacter pontiacus]|tara:strand:+ start:300 stop:710 length:411 start_codon:yes stop_codon:yes gene_type:complete